MVIGFISNDGCTLTIHWLAADYPRVYRSIKIIYIDLPIEHGDFS